MDNINDKCICVRKKCLRHGKCDECIEYHKNYKRLPLPYCERKKLKVKNKSES